MTNVHDGHSVFLKDSVVRIITDNQPRPPRAVNNNPKLRDPIRTDEMIPILQAMFISLKLLQALHEPAEVVFPRLRLLTISQLTAVLSDYMLMCPALTIPSRIASLMGLNE